MKCPVVFTKRVHNESSPPVTMTATSVSLDITDGVLSMIIPYVDAQKLTDGIPYTVEVFEPPRANDQLFSERVIGVKGVVNIRVSHETGVFITVTPALAPRLYQHNDQERP